MGKKITAFLLYSGVFLASAALSAVITFALTIRGGRVYVPKLTGLKLEEARLQARSLGLEVKVVARLQEEGMEPGIVLSQEPFPGMEIKRGGEIQVAVSEGTERVKLPDFRGKKVEEVRMELEDLGLEIGNITRIFYPGLEGPSVMAQFPRGGEEVPRGGYVDLLVGLPLEEAFVMPDFIGKSFELVQARLISLGFRVAPAKFVDYPGWEPGIIVQQLPFPGYKITKGQEITFKVTR